MKTHLKKLWPLAALAFLFLTLIALSLHFEDKPLTKLLRWPDGVTVPIIAFTLLAIAWQSIETAASAKATEDSVRISNQTYKLQEVTAKQQLRAYVVLKSAKALFLDDGSIVARIELQNCGQTPAYALQVDAQSGFSSYPAPNTGDPAGAATKSNSIVGADRSFTVTTTPAKLDGIGREDLIQLLNDKNTVFFVRGISEYTDIFGKKYRLRLQVILGGPAGFRDLAMDKQGRLSAVLLHDSQGNLEESL